MSKPVWNRANICYNIADMKTIAENANDFASIRTMDRGSCISVDKADFLVTFCGLVRIRMCKH